MCHTHCLLISEPMTLWTRFLFWTDLLFATTSPPPPFSCVYRLAWWRHGPMQPMKWALPHKSLCWNRVYQFLKCHWAPVLFYLTSGADGGTVIYNQGQGDNILLLQMIFNQLETLRHKIGQWREEGNPLSVSLLPFTTPGTTIPYIPSEQMDQQLCMCTVTKPHKSSYMHLHTFSR